MIYLTQSSTSWQSIIQPKISFNTYTAIYSTTCSWSSQFQKNPLKTPRRMPGEKRKKGKSKKKWAKKIVHVHSSAYLQVSITAISIWRTKLRRLHLSFGTNSSFAIHVATKFQTKIAHAGNVSRSIMTSLTRSCSKRIESFLKPSSRQSHRT